MHPIYTMSFADREMFAYNAKREKQRKELDRVLAQPENRIKYAFQFLTDFGQDCDETRKKCYDKISEWSDKLDTSEAHY
jgi:methylmalonyl-CoA mutase N-terminal domain/subunit